MIFNNSINKDDFAKEDNIYDLDRMFGEGNYEDKIKLFLNVSIYEKFYNESVSCEVFIKTKDGKKIDLPKCKIHHPYPNKLCYFYGMIKNRKLTSNGSIILLFDSYEEISNIENVTFVYKIVYDNDSIGTVKISYDVEFKKPQSDTQLTYNIVDHSVMGVLTYYDYEDKEYLEKEYDLQWDYMTFSDLDAKYEQKLVLESHTSTSEIY